MKKAISLVLCFALLLTSAFALVACEGVDGIFASLVGEDEETFSFEGKTCYIIGEEFEGGKVLSSKGNAYDVTKENISGFSTESSTGNSKFTVNIGKTELQFPYFVCMEATALNQADAEETSGIYIIKNEEYGTRIPSKEGNAVYGPIYDSETARDQIFDAYLPDEIGKIHEDAPVLLYIHGGGWIMGDKDVEGPALCTMYAQNGFIVFSMNYNMQTMTGSAVCSMDDIVSDIGTMVAYLKYLLPTLGIKTEKIAIGGVSAGGHLSGLYAYTMNDYSPLKIAFEVDIVGPNRFSTPAYKALVEGMLHPAESTSTSGGSAVRKLLASSFPGIIKGLLGEEKSKGIDLTKEDLTEVWELIDQYSPVFAIDENTCPTICAYGKVDPTTATGLAKSVADLQFFGAEYENDLLVPTSCYYEMVEALTLYEVPYVAKLFEGQSHLEVGQTPDTQAWIVEQSLKFAELYL